MNANNKRMFIATLDLSSNPCEIPVTIKLNGTKAANANHAKDSSSAYLSLLTTQYLRNKAANIVKKGI